MCHWGDVLPPIIFTHCTIKTASKVAPLAAESSSYVSEFSVMINAGIYMCLNCLFDGHNKDWLHPEKVSGVSLSDLLSVKCIYILLTSFSKHLVNSVSYLMPTCFSSFESEDRASCCRLCLQHLSIDLKRAVEYWWKEKRARAEKAPYI